MHRETQTLKFFLQNNTNSNPTPNPSPNLAADIGIPVGLASLAGLGFLLTYIWIRFHRKRQETENEARRDAVKSNLCDFISGNIQKHSSLPDYKYSHIDLSKLPPGSSIVFWGHRFLSAHRLYGLAMDILLCREAMRPSAPLAITVIYITCTLLSILLLLRDVARASVIVESDDVSDSYTHEDAYKWWVVSSRRHFNLLYAIEAQCTLFERLQQEMFWALRTGVRVFLVDVPTLFISVLMLTSSKGPKGDEQVLVPIKIILMGVRLFAIGLVILLYPFLKLWLMCGDVSDHISFTVESRLHQLVQKSSLLMPGKEPPAMAASESVAVTVTAGSASATVAPMPQPLVPLPQAAAAAAPSM